MFCLYAWNGKSGGAREVRVLTTQTNAMGDLLLNKPIFILGEKPETAQLFETVSEARVKLGELAEQHMNILPDRWKIADYDQLYLAHAGNTLAEFVAGQVTEAT
jgi:hypothetical protein